jgi:hypothetical protein
MANDMNELEPRATTSSSEPMADRDLVRVIHPRRTARRERSGSGLDTWLGRLAKVAVCLVPLLGTVWAVRFYRQQEQSEARSIIFRTYERWDSVYDSDGRLWDDHFRAAVGQLSARDKAAVITALKPLVVAREARQVTIASADPWLKQFVGPSRATSDESLQDACVRCHVSIVKILNLYESIRETYMTSDVSARRVLDEGYRETLARRLRDLRSFVMFYRELNQNPNAWAPLNELMETGNWGK